MRNPAQFPYLQRVLDELSTGIMFVDPHLCVTYANSFAAGLSGDRPQDLTGCSVRELTTRRFGSATGRYVTRHYIDVLRSGDSYTERRWESPVRPGFFTEQHMRRVDGPDGKPLGVLVTFTDVTDYVHAEQALRQSEERLRESEERFFSAFEYAAIGMALVSPEGRWLRVNRAFCGLVGYSRDELLARTFQDITHPDDLEADLGYVRQMLSGEIDTYQMEKRYIHKSRRVVWVLLSVSMVRDDLGRPLYFISQIQDFTERKKAEDALRESAETLHLAERASRSGSWDWDIVTGRMHWDAELFVVFGLDPTKETESFETWRRIIHPDDVVTAFQSIDTALREHIPLSSESRIILPDGRIRWIYATGEAIYNDEGSPVRMIGICLDITERKQAEEQLKRAARMEAEARALAQHQSELLQEALLPRISYVPEGYRVSARYVPGTPELDIGGDFYDLLIAENGQIALLIGDVSGKGVEAASLASSTRATVRAFAYSITSPGDALAHANVVICAQEKERRGYAYQFVTVGLVVIDPKTGTLGYSSAGHPPPLIRRASGKVDILRFGQPPVGIEPDTEYTDSESRLNPGDKIILYTDGVSEARQGKKFFELEGIKNTLKLYGDREADVVVENLIADATLWAGGTLQDDAVVIVVERLRRAG